MPCLLFDEFVCVFVGAAVSNCYSSNNGSVVFSGKIKKWKQIHPHELDFCKRQYDGLHQVPGNCGCTSTLVFCKMLVDTKPGDMK